MTEKEYAIRPNKTQIKREIRVFNDLGKELVAMPDSELKKIPLSSDMVSAIIEAKRYSRGALQRQLRRIASMMQREDIAAIQLELQRQKQPSKQQTAEFHQLEQWRDRLVTGDEKLLTDLIQQFPTIDRQRIRQLVRNAIKERSLNKAPKSSRLLFRYLAELKKTTTDKDSDSNGAPESTAENTD